MEKNESKCFFVIKKDGTKEEYNVQKVVSAVQKSATRMLVKLTDEEIKNYINTNEPNDKAGSYAIQGKASLFVKGIKGDYFNVVGLPLCRLGLMLKEFGVILL